ncbi:MAG TPA: 4-hydroxy-3-methylbut-2-enyl diphosphate reductase [Clostridia bacterium]|nr:4-hydroxy-3-methylbut-2-enyl diphosphate reductase [Clostridia bacterium]
MKVIVADHSGFCFGVERAIRIAFEKLDDNNDKKDIYTLGPLIHNQQVVNKLQSAGIKVNNSLEDLKDNSIVIVRSHGISKNVYDLINKKNIDIIDATCPFVRKIQNIVKKYNAKGYTIVIVGNPDHPEVIGINGWCDNQAYIVKTKNDVKKIPSVQKLCIVAQTTIPTSSYDELSNMVEEKAGEVIKFDTICSATVDRQESAKNLAKNVEAVVVIGGYHSSNTQKLVDICRSEKPNTTFHIEVAKELPIGILKKYEVVGITAGASTPKWIIDEVVEKLSDLSIS